MGLRIDQTEDQQLAHQVAQGVFGIARFAAALVDGGKKIAVEAGQPSGVQRQRHHDVRRLAVQAPAAMTIHYRQFIGLQVPTRLAIAEFDAALKQP